MLPGHDAVIVFTSALQNREPRLLALVWDRLVPALGATATGDAALANRIAGLALPDRPGAASGRTSRFRHVMARNAAGLTKLEPEFADGRCVFNLHDARGRHRIECGLGYAIDGWTTITVNALHHENQPDRMRVLARAVWQGDDLHMSWRSIETAFCDDVRLCFVEGGIAMRRSVNTSAGLMTLPEIAGRSA